MVQNRQGNVFGWVRKVDSYHANACVPPTRENVALCEWDQACFFFFKSQYEKKHNNKKAELWLLELTVLT